MFGLRRVRSFLRETRASLVHLEAELHHLEAELHQATMLSGSVLVRNLEQRIATTSKPLDLRSAEFKVFSQFGEDGIIQYLIRRAKVPRELQIFVEFGVEAYTEANSRFLLMHDNWRGLIMDGSASNIRAVTTSPIFWKYDLTAKYAFIDRENVDKHITESGFSGEIGILSIDIDGNDYWVWERISAVSPMIVIVEYNSVLGPKQAVTIPYEPSFMRGRAHYSHLYWGCSLRALELLAERKGYALVGSNSAGNNAFFLRRDCLNGQPVLSSEEAYVESRFRESRDLRGHLNFLSGTARLQEIASMPIFDVEANTATEVKCIAL